MTLLLMDVRHLGRRLNRIEKALMPDLGSTPPPSLGVVAQPSPQEFSNLKSWLGKELAGIESRMEARQEEAQHEFISHLAALEAKIDAVAGSSPIESDNYSPRGKLNRL